MFILASSFALKRHCKLATGGNCKDGHIVSRSTEDLMCGAYIKFQCWFYTTKQHVVIGIYLHITIAGGVKELYSFHR